jgi:hypothetical protein
MGFGWTLVEEVPCKTGDVVGGGRLYDQTAGGDIEYLVLFVYLTYVRWRRVSLARSVVSGIRL